MKKVFKYQIPVADNFDIPMPMGAQILCAMVQHSNPCIWALVNPDAPTERRCFRLVGTGHQVTDDACQVYIGSFQILSGDLVFHLFDQGVSRER